MKPIILIGGGGHCKSVIEAAESCGKEIKGILDLPSTVGTSCLGYPVISTDDDIPKYVGDCEFMITLGFIKNPALRNKLHKLVETAGGELATIVASTAHVSRYAEVGKGTVILHCATINAGARIGMGCIINTHANIEHDVRIGDFCHVSTGVMINGDCSVGENSFIGSGSILCNNVSVCPDVVLGAGSVVTNDIFSGGTYVGTPAKLIR